ncbi:aldose 1-epimerase [Paenibacillus sp. GCM10023248]|uniref:aldose 1-epimerase n=1 Tax=unclassified Paenibacillus TaxID=185978 RepID=UPI00237830A0|nr:aldose 1-epimerase [Paenibacillus sp. MAHUQ-63]MDD9268978.1 aldose 1-epimerase [Paenibacillus sp. MAHUQ-63]
MSGYAVEIRDYGDYTAIELHDGYSQAKATLIPECGNNLIAYACRGKPVITPPPDMTAFIGNSGIRTWYGIPILFPPNRVKGGRFSFEGTEYVLPINEPPHYHLHGDLSRKPWIVDGYGAAEENGAYVTCSFHFKDHPDILAYYGHELSFTVTYTLDKGRLDMHIAAVNHGSKRAPFAFGLHPYLAVPASSGPCTLVVPAAEQWPITPLSFVTGEPSATELCGQWRRGVALADYPEAGCFMFTLSEEDRICRLEMKEAGYRIAYEPDRSFPVVLLFKPGWADAFSIEPYTCVTDAFNLHYPDELTGARGLSPGEEVQMSTGLWVELV